jgi:hypothetical protein
MATSLLRVSAVLAGLAACSSFDAAEGGRTEADGGAVDAGLAVADAGPTGATPDGEAGTCSARPDTDPAHFCDDFDRGGRVDLRWSMIRTNGAGTIGESTGASAPRAFQAVLAGGSPPANAQLVRTRPAELDVATKKRLTLSFALRLDAVPYGMATGSGYTHLAVVAFDTPPCATSGGLKQREIELTFFANQDLRLAAKGLLGTCTDGGPGDDFFTLPAPFRADQLGTGAYHRVVIDLQRASCTGEPGASLRMTIDGVSSECRTLGVDPFDLAQALEVSIGAFAGGSAAINDTKISYDDVAIDLD